MDDELEHDNQHTPPGSFSTTEVIEAAGISYRMLDGWRRRGYVAPSLRRRYTGSGNMIRWSQADVDHVLAIAERVRWGLTLEAAARTSDPGQVPPAYDPRHDHATPSDIPPARLAEGREVEPEGPRLDCDCWLDS
jgi:hypothetical protein